MKLSRYAADKNNPAVKGNLTAEEIVRTDWERNFKDKGFSFPQVKMAIKNRVDAGEAVFRLRNTLFLVAPRDGFIEVEVHAVTADPSEVFQTMTSLFLLGLHMDQGTESVYTYTNDRKVFRMFSRLFGNTYVDIDDSDDPEKGKYVTTLDVVGIVRAAQAQKGNK
jgi:endo-1,4-beta-D-glucanase Y